MKAVYKLVPNGPSWSVAHDDELSDPFTTKEAAFEAAVATIERAMAEGYEIELSIPGGVRGRFA